MNEKGEKERRRSMGEEKDGNATKGASIQPGPLSPDQDAQHTLGIGAVPRFHV